MEFKKSLKNFLNINEEANTKENGVENENQIENLHYTISSLSFNATIARKHVSDHIDLSKQKINEIDVDHNFNLPLLNSFFDIYKPNTSHKQYKAIFKDFYFDFPIDLVALFKRFEKHNN